MNALGNLSFTLASSFCASSLVLNLPTIYLYVFEPSGLYASALTPLMPQASRTAFASGECNITACKASNITAAGNITCTANSTAKQYHSPKGE